MKNLLARKMEALHQKKESGINMVDLMMWLVIAALILAAALQGIAYYQQAAFLYHVKNDVMGGATRVVSVSGMEHKGRIDESVVSEGLVITDKTRDVVLVSDTDPNNNPMIRGTHPGIPGKEVIYLFKPYGIYPSENVIVIDEGDLPSGTPSNNPPASSLYPGSDWDGDGTPNSEDPDIDNDGIPNETDPDVDGTDQTPPVIFDQPGGDIDGDGISNQNDSDADGDGTINVEDSTPAGDSMEPQDLSGPDKGDGTTAASVGTVSAGRDGVSDGSLDFNDADHDLYGHAHEPLSPRMATAGQFELIGWSYNPSSPHRVGITFWGDGVARGVGGSVIVLGHVDVTCQNLYSKEVTKKVDQYAVGLAERYIGRDPGPNSTTGGAGCLNGEKVLKAVWRPATQTEWENYSRGSLSYVWTRNVVEGWVNPNP